MNRGRALVISHCAAEGPGQLAEWLPAAGLEVVPCRPWQGDPVPAQLEHDALVVLGGPQQAYDDRSAGWLRATKELLAQATAAGRPVLAVCLGAQLLAEATGGRVRPGPAGPELGLRLVARRDAAAPDPVFGGLPFTPAVVQWHWDEISELPPAALLLASSSRYPNQAFRVGAAGYGLQFHVEVTEPMLTAWVAAEERGLRERGLDPDDLLAVGVAGLAEVAEVWRPAVARWAGLAISPDRRQGEA